jgi:hypothetical protein
VDDTTQDGIFPIVYNDGEVHSHLPDFQGSYLSLCKLVRSHYHNPTRTVREIGLSKTVDCPKCIGLFGHLHLFTEVDLNRGH